MPRRGKGVASRKGYYGYTKKQKNPASRGSRKRKASSRKSNSKRARASKEQANEAPPLLDQLVVDLPESRMVSPPQRSDPSAIHNHHGSEEQTNKQIVWFNEMIFDMQGTIDNNKVVLLLTLNPANAVAAGPLKPSMSNKDPSYRLTYCRSKKWLLQHRMQKTHGRVLNFYLFPMPTKNSGQIKDIEDCDFTSEDWVSALKQVLRDNQVSSIVLCYGKTHCRRTVGTSSVAGLIINKNLHALHRTILPAFKGAILAMSISPVSDNSKVLFPNHPSRYRLSDSKIHAKTYEYKGTIGVKASRKNRK